MLSTVQPPERRPSPLSSNNPFRNRAASPINAFPSPPSPNKTSRNPFLDSSEQSANMTTTNGRVSPSKPALTGNTAELFKELSMDDKKAPDEKKSITPIAASMRKPENIPPREGRRLPPPGHRPSKSRDEDDRRRRGPTRGKTSEQLDIFADPSDATPRTRRPRRNSETSVVDRNSKSLETDDERRKRKQKEREARRRDGSKHGGRGGKVPSHRLDTIDKLDVTSIFGTGVFHHDGPFDACNPARNKKGHRTAPMAAFPKGSTNMAIGGSGPVNKDIDHAQFHGVSVDAYHDYSTSAIPQERPGYLRNDSFVPTMKVEPVHGDESTGLGTSTFLEGAPASRAAIARHEEESAAAVQESGTPIGGLGRKKSLAQRIRGISNTRPERFGPNGRITSPEPNGLNRITTPTSPPFASANGAKGDSNPYFQDYDAEYAKKGAKISAAETSSGRVRGLSSPKRLPDVPTLERTNTGDSLQGGEGAKTGGGFLNRVKSLRKPRGDRSAS